MYISIHIHTASYYSYIIEDTACRYLEYFSCSLSVSKHDHYPSGRPSPPSSFVVCSHVQAQVWNQRSSVELRLRGTNQDVSLEARLEHLLGRDRSLSPRILKRSNAVVRHLQNLKKIYFAFFILLCCLCITLSIFEHWNMLVSFLPLGVIFGQGWRWKFSKNPNNHAR